MPEIRQGREGALELARAALAGIEASRAHIDDLNVYPVPDGDTGTNMAETVRAVVHALEGDENADLVRAVLMGARGNSGVILSQLVRGAAEALSEVSRVDTSVLAASLRRASETGYAAVRQPQEGTILTLARALAERAEALAASNPPLEDALAQVVAAGEEALARTPEQLDVLRDAGVVDAGAAGLLEIVRGIASYIRGEPLPERDHVTPLPLEAVHREFSRYRYCTTFFVEGAHVDPDRLEAELGVLGDSLLVVGAHPAVKAHVHTDDPGRALSIATAVGIVEEIDIKNMHAQTAERTDRLARDAAVTGAVAVCSGAGNRRLFESLGAVCVGGGGGFMNPSAAELLAAIEGLPEAEVIVLLNNKKVTPAAAHAAGASAKNVLVVATQTLQAGLGALVAFEPGRSAAENEAGMRQAAAAVRSGAVTRATRSATIGGLEVEQGQFLGLVEGEPVTSGPVLEPVAREVVERLLGEASDVLTVLIGEGVGGAEGLVEAVRDAHPGLEIEVHEGGQLRYPLLFAVE